MLRRNDSLSCFDLRLKCPRNSAIKLADISSAVTDNVDDISVLVHGVCR